MSVDEKRPSVFEQGLAIAVTRLRPAWQWTHVAMRLRGVSTWLWFPALMVWGRMGWFARGRGGRRWGR